MAGERTTAEILAILTAQARLGPALVQTAEEISVVSRTVVPADLEPAFFA